MSFTGTSDLTILVVSCDAYQDLWRPFFECFFKYWPDCPYPVYLGTNFQAYPDTRVHTINVGPDIDYSSNLLGMLEHIPSDWVITWIDDRVLAASVNTRRLQQVIRLAAREKVAYVKLLANHPYALCSDVAQEVGEIPKGTRYRVCMTIGLWNKSSLIKLLCPGESAWDIERHGSERSNELSEKFLAPCFDLRRNPFLADTHLIIKGRLLRDGLRFLKLHGLDTYLAGRSIQSLSSYWYVKTYVRLNDFHAYVVRQWWRAKGIL